MVRGICHYEVWVAPLDAPLIPGKRTVERTVTHRAILWWLPYTTHHNSQRSDPQGALYSGETARSRGCRNVHTLIPSHWAQRSHVMLYAPPFCPTIAPVRHAGCSPDGYIPSGHPTLQDWPCSRSPLSGQSPVEPPVGAWMLPPTQWPHALSVEFASGSSQAPIVALHAASSGQSPPTTTYAGSYPMAGVLAPGLDGAVELELDRPSSSAGRARLPRVGVFIRRVHDTLSSFSQQPGGADTPRTGPTAWCACTHEKCRQPGCSPHAPQHSRGLVALLCRP